MKKKTNSRPIVAVVLVAALAVCGLNFGHPAHASTTGNPTFFVGNTAANPVPTAAQGTTMISGNVGITGTPNVNVSNVPAVQSQQSGPWTVGVNGTPTVNVASLPAVTLSGTPTVNIANGGINATPAFHVESVVDNVPLQTAKTYTLNAPVNTTAILGTAAGGNDAPMELFLNACLVEDCSSTAPLRLVYNNIAGTQSNIILNFNQPIRIRSILVSNDSSQVSLAFVINLVGN